MKYLVFGLCLVFAAGVATASKELEFLIHLQKVEDACANETNATPEEIESLMGGNIPTTHAGKCMAYCIMLEYGVVKVDGSLNKTGLMNLIDHMNDKVKEEKSKIVALAEICETQLTYKEDPCENAKLVMECGYDNMESVGLEDEK